MSWNTEGQIGKMKIIQITIPKQPLLTFHDDFTPVSHIYIQIEAKERKSVWKGRDREGGREGGKKGMGRVSGKGKEKERERKFFNF